VPDASINSILRETLRIVWPKKPPFVRELTRRTGRLLPELPN
jgi:hypothetical protein